MKPEDCIKMTMISVLPLIKIHTLLDLRDSIPTFIEITDGKVHDVNILDLLVIEAGAIYIMDRAYVDFANWIRNSTQFYKFSVSVYLRKFL